MLLDASNTATGVEYVPSIGAGFSSTEPVPKPLVVHARKLVVVSAGAISTPCILERSGIGRRDVLLAAGVEPVVEIPAVGEHYQDHNVLFPVFQAAPEVDTHDDISSGNIVANAAAEKEFAATGTGKYTTNILDFAGKIRPCAKEIQEMGPAFLDRWVQFFEKKQDKPVGFIAIIDTCVVFLERAVARNTDVCRLLAPTRAGLDPKAKFLTFAMYSAYPIASGHVHITSASPYAVPETDSGILEHEADLAVLVWVYKGPPPPLFTHLSTH